MKPRTYFSPKPAPKRGQSKSFRIVWFLRLLLLLSLSGAAQAQFNYTTQNGMITVTGYTGPGGEVIIPDVIEGLPVTNIGDEAFYRNASLTSVTIPNSVTNIGNFAFERCISLTSATFGTGVTSIGYNAFSRTALTSVSIPNGVTYIHNQAFGNCTSLTSVEIPSSATGIGGSAFINCSSLTSVTIPSGVNGIGGTAFYGCASLASVTIPGSVTDIGVLAFGNCASLNSVYFQGNAPTVGTLVFDGSPIVTVYYLPGTTGWDPTFGYRPTAPWVLPAPLILNNDPRFGVQTNRFGFIISWAMNLPVVVEACADLANPSWAPVGTNTLNDGWFYFIDPQWTNFSTRLYRSRAL